MSLKGVVSSILLSFIFFVYLPSHAYAKLVNIHAQFDEKTDTIYYKGKTYEISELHDDDSEEEEEENSNSMKVFGIRNLDGNSLIDLEEVMKEQPESMEAYYSYEESGFWIFLGISLGLTLFAGLMSGLTVGYLSIDELVLEMKLKNGTPQEIRDGSKIMPILSKHHWLLCTLLVANAAAMEALPIFLEACMPAYLSIIVSVSLVLLFGEIIPQAVCTGPEQIKIAAGVAPLVKCLMWIESPISYPIALILDKLLGEHHKSRFQNSDLKALIELHSKAAIEQAHIEDSVGDSTQEKLSLDIGLHPSQTRLILGALDMHNMKVKQVMIPYQEVFSINIQDNLSKEKIRTLLNFGKSRFPVYRGSKDNIVGIFRIKKLIGTHFSEENTFEELEGGFRKAMYVSPEMPLNELLLEFQKGRSHIALVTEAQKHFGVVKDTENVDTYQRFATVQMEGVRSQTLYEPPSASMSEKMGSTYKNEILGIATLEDVIEEVLKTEIYDEDDYDQIRSLAKHLPRFNRSTTEEQRELQGRQLMKIIQEGSELPNLLKKKEEEYQRRGSGVKKVGSDVGSELKELSREREILNKPLLDP